MRTDSGQRKEFAMFRALALFFDFVAATYVGLIVSLLTGLVPTVDTGLPGRIGSRTELWIQLLGYFFIYVLIAETWRGTTLGKLVFRMKVMDEAIRKPSPLRILIRNVVMLVEMTLFPIAMLAYLIAGKSMSERKSGIRVVRARQIESTD